jgi:hypothetical protein
MTDSRAWEKAAECSRAYHAACEKAEAAWERWHGASDLRAALEAAKAGRRDWDAAAAEVQDSLWEQYMEKAGAAERAAGEYSAALGAITGATARPQQQDEAR